MSFEAPQCAVAHLHFQEIEQLADVPLWHSKAVGHRSRYLTIDPAAAEKLPAIALAACADFEDFKIIWQFIRDLKAD
jgi:hypothetical protein